MIKVDVQNPSVEVTFEDEGIMINHTASVRIYCAGQCVQIVEAFIDKGKGADGGWYNYVKFRKVEMTKK